MNVFNYSFSSSPTYNNGFYTFVCELGGQGSEKFCILQRFQRLWSIEFVTSFDFARKIFNKFFTPISFLATTICPCKLYFLYNVLWINVFFIKLITASLKTYLEQSWEKCSWLGATFARLPTFVGSSFA